MSRFQDLVGMRFGRLTVTSYAGQKNGRTMWNCVCDCGKETIVDAGNLKKGCVLSCGCLRRERFLTHGLSKTALYHVWTQIRQRCYNDNDKSYRWYGGKGISVCDEWKDYENFYQWAQTSGYHEGLSIDRIDETLDYCPENCRWILSSENSQRATEKLLSINGETLNMSQWSERIGVNVNTVSYWMRKKGEEYTKARILAFLHPGQYTIADVQVLNPHKRERYLSIDGKTLNLSDWAKEACVNKSTIGKWISCGEEYAASRIKERINGDKPDLRHVNTRFLTVDGRTFNFSQWAKIIGVSKTSIGKWYKTGEDYAIERIRCALLEGR